MMIVMEAVLAKLSDIPTPVVASFALAVGTVVIYKVFLGREKLISDKHEKDVVYLYQFPRPKTLPNLSPFCLKVESFLRINGIEYKCVLTTTGRSKQGYLPYVILNGEQIDDSELIIEKLSEKFGVQPLPPREEAMSNAVCTLADNHLFYVILKYKILCEAGFRYCCDLLRDLGVAKKIRHFIFILLASFLTCIMKSKTRARISAGLGMFPDEDFDLLLHKDLNAIRDILGTQKFLFGDKPTVADCAVFGQLASAYYLSSANHIRWTIEEKYPTIHEYLENMRKTAYGDSWLTKEYCEERRA